MISDVEWSIHPHLTPLASCPVCGVRVCPRPPQRLSAAQREAKAKELGYEPSAEIKARWERELLCQAAGDGKTADVQRLLNAGADVNAAGPVRAAPAGTGAFRAPRSHARLRHTARRGTHRAHAEPPAAPPPPLSLLLPPPPPTARPAPQRATTRQPCCALCSDRHE